MSIFRVAFSFRFTFPGDLFPNVDRIGNIACPLLIIHGTRDEVVPFSNGEGLFFAAPISWRAKPFWVEGGGHNNIETMLRCENEAIKATCADC
jgi:abhydrolase domain-containing protein 17